MAPGASEVEISRTVWLLSTPLLRCVLRTARVASPHAWLREARPGGEAPRWCRRLIARRFNRSARSVRRLVE